VPAVTRATPAASRIGTQITHSYFLITAIEFGGQGSQIGGSRTIADVALAPACRKILMVCSAYSGRMSSPPWCSAMRLIMPVRLPGGVYMDVHLDQSDHDSQLGLPSFLSQFQA
jgi:hypothetical protein